MTKLILTAGLLAARLIAQNDGLVPVRTIITVESRHDHEKRVPTLTRDDVMAFERHDRLQVTNLAPATGAQAGLELYLLIDDASGVSLGSQLGDLRHFIETQPADVLIGIGYMRNGTVQTVAPLSTNHEAASKTLRLPISSGGVSPSPYLSLSDLIKRWPASPNRHEVILITSGLDPLGGPGPDNPYVTSAIEDAQRHGVVVFSIYTPSAGHGSHAFFGLTWAQSHLSQLAEETGGESYMLGFSAPVSFASYLDGISDRLVHQYVVGFLMKPEHKSSLRSVRFTTELPNAEIVAPAHIYVPAAAASK